MIFYDVSLKYDDNHDNNLRKTGKNGIIGVKDNFYTSSIRVNEVDQILKDIQLIPKVVNNPKSKSDMPVEDIVKNHLEIIILSLLLEKSMCGYDLIKEIITKYNVMISQGTVYPLLYSLKGDGIIHVESMKGDMKTKRYSITEDARNTIEKKIDGFIKTEEYILNSIRNW